MAKTEHKSCFERKTNHNQTKGSVRHEGLEAGCVVSSCRFLSAGLAFFFSIVNVHCTKKSPLTRRRFCQKKRAGSFFFDFNF